MDKIIMKVESTECKDHKVEYLGGDSAHSEFGCMNCNQIPVVEPEDAGTGA